MIDRNYIAAILENAKACDPSLRTTVSCQELSELCRVYLAWLDAPTSRMIQTFTYDNDFLAATDISADDEERLSGKTVRLVEVK